ncbi:LysR family transcriptional regulator [Pseudomonas brassicacearum]|uniref:LysR substrate-binding domain-containing protein n=1 Tax=Pseudomonas brassicacearum TaxID=930166 RepID=UPI000F483B55|nr:LysR substrate-binding domain-containing protein [Pseudomonas brassicacearum]ROM82898.1 LysR family transcriptional regulator [Pseudomonas brassicacearum]
MILPPLNSLRMFEVVARLGHLGAAAAELHVTPGAVSQQIRALQNNLGVELFQKQGRHLVLTPSGLVLQRAVARGMGEIGQGVRQVLTEVQAAEPFTVVTICTEPVLGTTWLLPKLFAFHSQHPKIRLRVITASAASEVDWKKADIALLYASPPWEGLWWRPLRSLNMFPVCCPQLLPHVRQPADLTNQRLLHEDDGMLWRRWLVAARVPYPGDADVFIQSFPMALQAARDGYGVALSDEFNSHRDLADGRLVRPFNLQVPAGLGYYCLSLEERRELPQVVQLIDWLTEEAGRDIGS